MKAVENANLLEKALVLVGKKYNLMILDSLMQNKSKRRFNQLLNDIPSLNPRILSMRLKELEKSGLVSKSLVLGTPVKTEYHLSDKAEELAGVIENLKNWALKKA